MVSEAKGINLAGYICRMIANICIHFLSQCTSEVYRTVISRIETEIIRKENAIGCIIRDRLSFTRNKQVFDFLNRVFIKGLAEYRVFSKDALLCALLFDLNNGVEGSVNSFFISPTMLEVPNTIW